MYSTKELIRNTIISVWSWKCRSSSIIGEVASWKPNWSGYGIEVQRVRAYTLTLTKLCNFFTRTSSLRKT